MVLRNFVVLDTDIPARMHFTEDLRATREITDPATGRPKTINIIEFTVDTLNGEAVNAVFSVTSEKLAQALEPFRANRRYLTMDITITRSGSGYLTEYRVDTSPR